MQCIVCRYYRYVSTHAHLHITVARVRANSRRCLCPTVHKRYDYNLTWEWMVCREHQYQYQLQYLSHSCHQCHRPWTSHLIHQSEGLKDTQRRWHFLTAVWQQKGHRNIASNAEVSGYLHSVMGPRSQLPLLQTSGLRFVALWAVVSLARAALARKVTVE